MKDYEFVVGDALAYYIKGVSFQDDPDGWVNKTDEE